MSMSKQTQQRYRKEWTNQSSLNAFGFSCIASRPSSSESEPLTQVVQASDCPIQSDTGEPHSVAPKPLQVTAAVAPVSIGWPRSATVLLDPSTDSVGSGSDESDHGLDAIEVGEGGQNNLQDVEAKDWEDELYEAVGAPISETHDWETLHAQIQHDLKRKHQDLSLSQINKLMTLSNFTTLRIKGASQIAASLEIANQWHQGAGSGIWFARRVRALARHYQIFEQLPTEKRWKDVKSAGWN